MKEKYNFLESAAAGDVILSMENITKIYSNGFAANKDVTFKVRKGELHGLVGENGAGKTTLMKVLFGQETPEAGTISIAGNQVKIDSPLVALDYGIGMVHQHFMLVPSLTVAENMVLGIEPVKGSRFDKATAVKLTKEVSEKYMLDVNPDALVKDLSVGFKQRVEILKMLLRGARLLLLDEPTAVLTPQETKELFIQLKNLKDQGFSIVFISHKLNEIKEICDRITVLRSGKLIGTVDVNDVSEADISRMMVGRDVVLDIVKTTAKPGDSVLRVRNLTYINKFGTKSFDDLSFDLRSGEIFGVAGVEGNGQSELSDAIAGLIKPSSGTIDICGESTASRSIREIRELGVSLIHEDRMTYGASKDQSISDNIIADRYYMKKYHKFGFMKHTVISEGIKELIKDFTIKCDGEGALVKTLSGGNIQKVVAAREFSSFPKLLIASQPTRGIDVGAAELIRNKIVELRDKHNTATLLFSADLVELLSVSDSIFVMFDGKIVAYFKDASAVDEQLLGEYMLGLKKQSDDVIRGDICV